MGAAGLDVARPPRKRRYTVNHKFGHRPANITDPLCQVCNLPAIGHLCCRDCQVFAGPGHTDRGLTADGYCGTCARARQMWESKP